MFAVVKTGGKQYKVQPNDIIEIEKVEAGVGSTIVLDNVLLVNDGANVTVGAPAVAGFGVAAEIINQKKADKVIVFKKKRRHNYRRKNGHRQLITVIKVKEIGKGLKSNILPFKTEEKIEVKKEAPAKPAKAKKETTAKSEAKPATPRKKAAGKTKAAE